MKQEIWQSCLETLQSELPPQQFNMWLRPLSCRAGDKSVVILAPNRFVLDWVRDKYTDRLKELFREKLNLAEIKLEFLVDEPSQKAENSTHFSDSKDKTREAKHSPDLGGKVGQSTNINPNYTFASFVDGKSNQLAKAAATQVAEAPGTSYNPLFIYGPTGLGKTHLMLAIGNEVLAKDPNAKVVYKRSESFVRDFVKALQTNTTDEFKRFYRSADVLLIDDIQFFTQKTQTQEEFFHTFNALLEGNHQIILTSDKYPKALEGVDERLKSRFGWGLPVEIEPPELETRTAILMKKAEQAKVQLPNEVAFFVAQKIRSNVRELEGALNRIIANARFQKREITLELVKESLKDLLAIQDRLITVDNIQKTVAEYYKIKLGDLTSKKRTRSIARPRQVAMALSKELTNMSLPEIGDAFGGRDHTTVMHACKKISELRNSDNDIEEDYNNLARLLSS